MLCQEPGCVMFPETDAFNNNFLSKMRKISRKIRKKVIKSDFIYAAPKFYFKMTTMLN